MVLFFIVIQNNEAEHSAECFASLFCVFMCKTSNLRDMTV